MLLLLLVVLVEVGGAERVDFAAVREGAIGDWVCLEALGADGVVILVGALVVVAGKVVVVTTASV